MNATRHQTSALKRAELFDRMRQWAGRDAFKVFERQLFEWDGITPLLFFVREQGSTVVFMGPKDSPRSKVFEARSQVVAEVVKGGRCYLIENDQNEPQMVGTRDLVGAAREYYDEKEPLT